MEFRPAIISVTIIHTVYCCPGYATVRELFILVRIVCDMKSCLCPGNMVRRLRWRDDISRVCVSHRRCYTSALAAVVSDCIVFRLWRYCSST